MSFSEPRQTPEPPQVALRFKKAQGRGAPIILIHGWCCNVGFMAPQFSHYAKRGQTVLALDLRGHGNSDKPHLPYTMQAFADDIALLCAELELRTPILIGHSMGGIVAYEIARRYPHLPAALIMLDASTVLLDSARAAMPALIERLRGPSYRNVLEDYVQRALLLAGEPSERRQELLAEMLKTPQHVMVSAMEGLRDYDPGPPDTAPTLPSLYIAADEAIARCDLQRLKQLMPQLQDGKTVGSGHFCQLDVPEQVNAMMDRFLTLTFPPLPGRD